MRADERPAYARKIQGWSAVDDPFTLLSMIAGADSLLAADRIVLLGEVHGTKQVPEAVVELARGFDGPLRVGVEWPLDQQAVVDAIFSGRDFDTSHDMWRVGFGLSSRAMVSMIEALGSRPDTRVFAFNEWSDCPDDERMARGVLAAYDAEPHAAFLILAGNVHTQTQRAGSTYKTMGEYLAVQAPIVAFDTVYRSGSHFGVLGSEGAWVEGVHSFVPQADRGDVPFVRWFSSPDDRGYDGELYLGDVEASPPYRLDSEG